MPYDVGETLEGFRAVNYTEEAGSMHTAMTGDVGMKALVFRIHKKGEPERILSE